MSFYFVKLLFVKVSEHSERCRVYLFDRTAYYFWSNALYFCPFRFYYLINSFFRDFVDNTNCTFNDVRSNFTDLVDRVSSSVWKSERLSHPPVCLRLRFFPKVFPVPPLGEVARRYFMFFFLFIFLDRNVRIF